MSQYSRWPVVGGGSGVSSVNGLTGALTLAAGSGISITPAGNTLTIAATGGTGTVTSVALAAPSIFTVSGSPVTTSGTLTLALATEAANTVFAGPTSGGAATPTFRSIVAADVSGLALSELSLTLTGTGGAGFVSFPAQSTAPAAPASGFTLYGGSTGRIAWKGTAGIAAAFDSLGITAIRIYTLPDATGTVALINSAAALLTGNALITSGTTYTTPAGINAQTRFTFTLVGGGGGGGGINTTNGKGSGGGGAGTAVVKITGLAASTAYTVAIGAGGAGGISTTTAATDGGNTTLTANAVTYTAGGGKAGASAINSLGGFGGGTTNATISFIGEAGKSSGAATANAPWGGGGAAGMGMGPGGAALAGNTAGATGTAGTSYGGGGSSGNGLAATGGAGAPGVIIVEWAN